MEGPDFSEIRRKVASKFAQTMIVVDDDAEFASPDERVTALRPPGQRDRVPDPESSGIDLAHMLDARAVVNGAIDIGMVCAVLKHRPDESIDDLKNRVLRAAERVDIVCLDWKISPSEEYTALPIIQELIEYDLERGGRLRLIAIYSGEHSRSNILEEIENSCSDRQKERLSLELRDGKEITSATGLKIVYIFKKHGLTLQGELLKDQVGEEELPKRLLEEFSSLSEGLLSNVALGTVATIRDVSHQVIGKFSGEMDAPYFHHRATIENPTEAEEYAVDLVLDEIESAVKLRNIGRTYAGAEAIRGRIKSLSTGNFSLRYREGQEKNFDIDGDNLYRLINNGCKMEHPNISATGEITKPKLTHFVKFFTSIFTRDIEKAEFMLKKFEALTNTSVTSGSPAFRHSKYRPDLKLGTILLDGEGRYWICLQANCDSVRIKNTGAFLMVPLAENEEKPDHVVFVENIEGNERYISLKIEGYTRARSFDFEPNACTETVQASRINEGDELFFCSVRDGNFNWIADLKFFAAALAQVELYVAHKNLVNK